VGLNSMFVVCYCKRFTVRPFQLVLDYIRYITSDNVWGTLAEVVAFGAMSSMNILVWDSGHRLVYRGVNNEAHHVCTS